MDELKYPIGIQSFEDLRRNGYVYIDKTAYIHNIINTGKYYFLSRPRRFGKSLLLSTIEAYFEGKRDLFFDLDISKKENDWAAYPILHLDLNTQKYDSPQDLIAILDESLTKWESIYGNDSSEIGDARRFAGTIRRAAEKTGKNVVILVDEYDKPLLQAFNNQPLLNEYRNTLKAFYGALKSCDKYIKFAMLTGVTKFGKVSVFSDLNNLEDISMAKEYSAICGITASEMHKYFDSSIAELAQKNDLSKETAYQRLKEDYDGYRFHRNGEGIYNPFSVLNTLKRKEFGSYWFETGTPTLLVDMLRKSDYDLSHLTTDEVDSDTLNCIFESPNPLPVIYQSGYLTIKSFDPEFETYRLGYPNREVKNGFLKFIMPFYTQHERGRRNFNISHFVRDIENGQVESFMLRIQSLFSDTPYLLAQNNDRERHYQNVVYILTKLMGFYVNAEYQTSAGRIDLTIETSRFIYLIEFKLDGSAEEALAQIKQKHYDEPFKSSGKEIIKIGANFSSQTKSIETWLINDEYAI